MTFQTIQGHPEEVDYLLFTGTFKIKDVFYKMAVAETITYDGDATGTHTVLQLSENGTLTYEIYKDKGKWVSGSRITLQAIVDAVGAHIDSLRK